MRLPLIIAAALLAVTPAMPQETAEREDVLTARMVVETVDMETRQVLLTDETGHSFTVVAGPEVRNLAQLDPGDTVEIGYLEAVAVKLAGAAGDGTVDSAVVAGRAKEGEKPGAVAGSVSSFVVEFVSYDPRTNVVTFIDPSKRVRAVTIRPEMRDFAAARQSGDLVDVTIERAIAISVTPMGE